MHHTRAQSYFTSPSRKLAVFSRSYYTLLRTSTGVATRPWRSPRLRAACPGPFCTREYDKDHVPQGLPLRNKAIISKFRPSGWKIWELKTQGCAGTFMHMNVIVNIAMIPHIRFHMCRQIDLRLRGYPPR